MKLYSLITICITLGLFYALAVFEQNKKVNEEKKDSSVEEIITYHRTERCYGSLSSDETSFDMMVTGKEHRYLNTGITLSDYEFESEPDRININTLIVSHDE